MDRQGMLPGMRGMSRVTNPRQVPTTKPAAARGEVEGQRMLPADDMLLMHAKRTVNGQRWTPEWRDAAVERLQDGNKNNVSISSIFPDHRRVFSTRSTPIMQELPYRYQNHDYLSMRDHRPGGVAQSYDYDEAAHSDLAWAKTPVSNVSTRHITFSQDWVRPKDVLFNLGESHPEHGDEYLPEFHPEHEYGSGSDSLQAEASSHPRMLSKDWGDTFVLDGHHRTVAALIDGERSIAARRVRIRDRS